MHSNPEKLCKNNLQLDNELIPTIIYYYSSNNLSLVLHLYPYSLILIHIWLWIWCPQFFNCQSYALLHWVDALTRSCNPCCPFILWPISGEHFVQVFWPECLPVSRISNTGNLWVHLPRSCTMMFPAHLHFL